jgi:hypothetical protein
MVMAPRLLPRSERDSRDLDAVDRGLSDDDLHMNGFHEGQKVWVEQADGKQRAAIFVGEAGASWFGGSPGVYVVYPDTRDGEEVAAVRVVARDG